MRLVLLLTVLLAGCAPSEQYHETDDKAVCTTEGKAYLVARGPGDFSLVKPAPHFDILCKR